MYLKEVRDILSADVLCGEELLDTEVQAACGSDFLSDVLAYVKNQALLLTGLINPQVIRTADMMDMKCIVFVRGKRPDEEIVSLARDRGLVVMATAHPMYPACGLLYTHGLKGD
jgi:predicted transcriptional regulator